MHERGCKRGTPCIDSQVWARNQESMQEVAHLQHPPSAHPPARVHHALMTSLALDILHGHGLDAGSTVAAKAGADAPGGGISLCFCRRGCAAPAQKAATLNDQPPRNQPKAPRNRHPATNPTLQQKKSGRKGSAGLLIQIIMMQSSKP